MSRRTPLVPVLLAAGTLILLFGTSAPDAAAQAAGQLVFTKSEPPAKASAAKLRRFIRKHRVRTITTTADAPEQELYVLATLRYRPKAAWIKLPHNNGKLRLGFYQRVKRRWTLANSNEVGYPNRARKFRFPFTFKREWGLKTGIRYQVRLSIRDARKREKVLARTYVRVK